MSEKYILEFEIQKLPATLNVYKRTNHHVIARELEVWSKLIYYSVYKNLPSAPLTRANLHLIRYSSSLPDYDGMVGGFKLVVDALVKNKILIDDNMFVTGPWNVEWKKVKPKQGKIYVKIETPD